MEPRLGIKILSTQGGNTPLHTAIDRANVEAVKFLFSHSELDIHVKNNNVRRIGIGGRFILPKK